MSKYSQSISVECQHGYMEKDSHYHTTIIYGNIESKPQHSYFMETNVCDNYGALHLWDWF